MNKVEITGAFDKDVEITTVNHGGRDVILAKGSLTFFVDRGGKQVAQWIDVEITGEKAYDLRDIPIDLAVTITGQIRRAAWKDNSDRWNSRHYIHYESHEMKEIPGDPAQQQAGEESQVQREGLDDDIPF